MKTTQLPGLFLLLGFAAQAAPVFAAAGGVPTRSPVAPDAPPMTWVSGDINDLFNFNTSLKTLLANPDPDKAKAFVASYGAYAPLITPNGCPPPDVDGNFVLGPVHPRDPNTMVQPGVPQGTRYQFTMDSADSKFYPGIDRVPNTVGTVDPNNPYTLLVPNSQPAPYTRQVTVFVPSQYVPGTFAPFIVTHDGLEGNLPNVVNNLIAQHKLPVMIVIGLAHGGNRGSDAQGSERGLEYDTMSGKFAEFIEAEVLPRVEKEANVKLTKDPEGRATEGGSSGGSAALEMAWYHPDLYHRVLTYSGTYVNQQWPFNPAIPHGAWEFHEHIIAESEVKPIRLWMEVGDRDLYNPNVMRDNMHDWVAANEAMAKVLKAKGYHYQFVFSINAGHVDGPTKAQTLAEAMEWLWQGYPLDTPPTK